MSGMKNINFKYLYRRTEQLLMVPETVWPEALNETNSGKELYRNYLIPITMVISIMVLLINLINYNFWQATGLTIINLIAMLIGNWFAYLITREYLCRKLSFDTNLALNLTVYSGVIFIIFHSIGNALGNIFLGQLFTLLSLYGRFTKDLAKSPDCIRARKPIFSSSVHWRLFVFQSLSINF